MISIDITNANIIADELNRLSESVLNSGDKLIEELGTEAIDETERRWFANGDGSWKPLSPRTIKRKGHAFPLVETGNMYNSLNYRREEKNALSINVPLGGRNNNPDVPAYHQYGTRRMPQRKILVASEKMAKRLQRVLSEYIRKEIRAVFNGVNYR